MLVEMQWTSIRKSSYPSILCDCQLLLKLIHSLLHLLGSVFKY